MYKKILAENKSSTEEEKEKTDKLYSIIKIGLICLILYFKNGNEFSDTIADLVEVTKFREGHEKVYMDVLISLLHHGSSMIK